LVTTTTTSPSTTSTHSTVEKLVHVVDTVVPQLVESIHHEFIETSTPAAPAVVTSPAPPTSTFTPTTITTTPPSTPPTFCNPVDSAHVQVNWVVVFFLKKGIKSITYCIWGFYWYILSFVCTGNPSCGGIPHSDYWFLHSHRHYLYVLAWPEDWVSYMLVSTV
jgi:hypothetical protein